MLREGNFISKNLKRWESYAQPAKNPDELAKQFTSLVDDLSYAKTFYPDSKTVKYINGLAANIYLSIYRNKKESNKRLLLFWTTELPLIIYKYRKTLLFTTLFFIAFIFLGVLSAYIDETFVRSVLGDRYVNMTEANIANGDPFGVYKGEQELTMFLKIAFNNIKVAFLTYFAGITFGAGTLYLLFTNGLMVGVFEFMFYHHLGMQSILVIFIHGTLELWSIVVAGTAGLILGNALLFPGTYRRIQSLRLAAKDSIKIITSLVPVFVVAAFFESFITRHTGMPVFMSSGILVLSALFIIGYYIVYPAYLNRKITKHAA
jgi:uncharacterized membrane protein SpoIIM required for sporulation